MHISFEQRPPEGRPLFCYTYYNMKKRYPLKTIQQKAFTLIELLVVIAIIGIITGTIYIQSSDFRQTNRLNDLILFDNSLALEMADYLVASYSFEEGSSGTASGITRTQDGFGNNGTIYGNPSWTEGIVGNALNFSGTNSWINLGSMQVGEGTEITVSAFVKSSVANQRGFIIGENPVNTRWEIYFDTGFLRWRGGAPVNNNASCAEPSINEWHHVIGTQKGTTARLYINGEMCVESTSTPAIINSTSDVMIGRFNSGSSYYFNGVIDELKVYSKAYEIE